MQTAMKDIISDVAKVGTMLVVSQALMTTVDPMASLQDRRWIQSSIYTLVGFSVYHLVTKRCVSTDNQTNPVVKAVWDDWLKVGTMLAVSAVLSGGNLNMNWVRGSMTTLVGFTLYQVITKHLVRNPGQTEVTRDIGDDWIKVGTMMTVSNILSGGRFDRSWAQSSLFTLLGFTTYHLVTRKYMK